MSEINLSMTIFELNLRESHYKQGGLKIVSARYNDEYRTVVKFNDNSIIVMTRSPEDKFDLSTAILYAFYYKRNGYSKTQTRKIFDKKYKVFCKECPNSPIDQHTFEMMTLYDFFCTNGGCQMPISVLEKEYCDALLKKMNREARKAAAKKEANK